MLFWRRKWSKLYHPFLRGLGFSACSSPASQFHLGNSIAHFFSQGLIFFPLFKEMVGRKWKKGGKSSGHFSKREREKKDVVVKKIVSSDCWKELHLISPFTLKDELSCVEFMTCSKTLLSPSFRANFLIQKKRESKEDRSSPCESSTTAPCLGSWSGQKKEGREIILRRDRGI